MAKQVINPLAPLKGATQEQHDSYTKDFVFNDMVNAAPITGHQVERTVSVVQTKSKVILLNKKKLKVSGTSTKIYPEYMAYTVGLEGCAAKLINYIIFHKINLTTNRFVFNDMFIAEFNDLVQAINSKKVYKPGVVKQALRKLVEANILQSVARGLYMVNPMIIAKDNTLKRALINEYSTFLINAGKDVVADFFPKYI